MDKWRDALTPRIFAVWEQLPLTVREIQALGWHERLACMIARQLVSCKLADCDDELVHYGSTLTALELPAVVEIEPVLFGKATLWVS